MFTPKKMFFTKGVGAHKDRLASFELALRDAGIEKCNLVTVSSILPPNCQITSKEKGEKMLHPGEVVFCVMARNETNEPNRLISAAIGAARPSDENNYGYLSEHHAFGEVAKKAGEYAEDLAATMLATTLGIEFDSDKAWEEREQIYKASGQVFKTTNICQSAEGNKDGLWTTVIAVAVFCDFYVHKEVLVPIIKDEIQSEIQGGVGNTTNIGAGVNVVAASTKKS
jgi:arginine decarboxylase